MPAAEQALKPHRNLLRTIIHCATKEPVLTVLVVALVALQVFHPRPWESLPGLVDWQTVMTLAGLLILTKAVEYSGFLMWLAHRVVHHIRSQRALAYLLIALAAALSTLLTNDVALFVVVPLALSLNELTPLPLKRLVIFIAIAVNAGSILTPLGNPQNLFLWQTSGVSFGGFVLALAPLCLALMAMLYALATVSFKRTELDLSKDTEPHPVDRPLLGVAVVLFAAFVLLADSHRAGIGLIGVGIGFIFWRPRIVLKIDWLLLLIFVFMFIVLRSVAALPWVHNAVGELHLPVHQQCARCDHAGRVFEGLASACVRCQRRRLWIRDRFVGESDCNEAFRTARNVGAISPLFDPVLGDRWCRRRVASVAFLTLLSAAKTRISTRRLSTVCPAFPALPRPPYICSPTA
jgi:di/tricarboxylate transporter